MIFIYIYNINIACYDLCFHLFCVSFAKGTYICRVLIQKRPSNVRTLQIVLFAREPYYCGALFHENAGSLHSGYTFTT